MGTPRVMTVSPRVMLPTGTQCYFRKSDQTWGVTGDWGTDLTWEESPPQTTL